MAFSQQTVDAAWSRQDGRCAYCGKKLVKDNRDRGTFGAWHPHHRKPRSQYGTDSLANCAILCINLPEHCHFKIGHKGNWANYAPLSDSDLRWLYEGQRKAQRQMFQLVRAQTQPVVKKNRRIRHRQPPPPTITTMRGI